ncbi:MAG: hypothetical protein IJX90_08370 [Blautia sp.]|nr:hypothetical protein [Blautia sp.]
MDSRVLNAFTSMGLKLIVNSTVSYSGYFSARDKSITLRQEGDTIYHELGHFLAFIAGNYDTGKDFQKVYAAEKGKYTGYNKSYVTQNCSEYFAECVKDYILDPSTMSKVRPESYKAVQTALSKVTTAQVTKMKLIMSVL